LLSAEALPSVFYLALDKAFFAKRLKKNARQSLRRWAKKRIPVVAVHGERKKKVRKIESRGKKQICVYNNEWVQAVVVVWIGGVVLL
jgi:hypothetical protein